MAGNSVLLDTTVVVNHLRVASDRLKSHLEAGGDIYLPLTVVGELFAGACRMTHREKGLDQILRFRRTCALLLPGEATAVCYGEIHAELAKAGTPIPQNDIWIAAFAREHGLPLATTDPHFKHVQGLNTLSW